MFVRCMDTNPPLMRVFGQWMVGPEVPGDDYVRLQAANAVTGALNLVKATIHENRLVIAVDLVVAGGLDLRSVLSATLDAILGSVQTWHATVLQLTGGPPPGRL
ncbi:MAG: hypothetical protein QG608_2284 [Actinomycetota bacterium]|nr:hypothetical protein [Actinomycetota bacterium]